MEGHDACPHMPTPDERDIVDVADYTLGDVLKMLRQALGLTQAEVARKLCSASSTSALTRHEVGRWEQGRVRPEAWLPMLAQVFDVDVDVLRSVPTKQRFITRTGDRRERSEVLRRTLLQKGIAIAVPGAGRLRGSRVLQALAVMGGEASGAALSSLGELVDHYALTICARPPAEVYGELLAVRSFSGDLARRVGAGRRHRDATLMAGWLSALLALSACDMGEHAAARVWCSDADRRGEEAQYPELRAWASLTRSMITFYQNQPRESAMLALRGRQFVSKGTVVYAKLASQEMRAAAMAGKADRMIEAKREAVQAISQLPSDAPTLGAFSINLSDDPPYTATSMMLIGMHREAVSATERVIRTVYQPETKQRGENPSGYARSLLILAMAHLGDGNLESAISAGHQALDVSRPAWPTMVLARRLDEGISGEIGGSNPAAEYHSRFLAAASSLNATSGSDLEVDG